VWIDSHIHLADPVYEQDIEELLGRAEDAGVKGFLLVACDPKEYEKAARLAESREGVALSFGCHPHHAAEFGERQWRDLERWLEHPAAVALGECGLDYHYTRSSKEAQRECFRRQIGMSLEKDLPLVVHTREADEDTVSAFGERPEARGVFHCYTGSLAIRDLADELGFYLGASGIVTFRSGKSVRDALRAWPLDRLLVETDGPYLAPVPHRGKRNEPAWVPLVGEQIAALHRVPAETVAEATTASCRELFGWPPPTPSSPPG